MHLTICRYSNHQCEPVPNCTQGQYYDLASEGAKTQAQQCVDCAAGRYLCVSRQRKQGPAVWPIGLIIRE